MNHAELIQLPALGWQVMEVLGKELRMGGTSAGYSAILSTLQSVDTILNINSAKMIKEYIKVYLTYLFGKRRNRKVFNHIAS